MPLLPRLDNEPGTRTGNRPSRLALGRITRSAAGTVIVAGALLGSLMITPLAGAQAALARHAQPAAQAQRHGYRAWTGYAGNAQHTAVVSIRPQSLKRIRWHVKVDLHPVKQDGSLPIHYASPMITTANTVLVPTRISAKAGFKVVAYAGATGKRRWSLPTDYRLPKFPGSGFTPPLPAALISGSTLAVAAKGGTVLLRRHVNAQHGAVRRVVFYGKGRWKAHKSAYDKNVKITTPITAGPHGSMYFGFTVFGSTPAHLASGIARISANGHATWIRAAKISGNKAFTGIAPNSAPALSRNGQTLYTTAVTHINESSQTQGILAGLNARTLRPRYRTKVLTDPSTGMPAVVLSDSTASPTIGPDGDVYFGVLENPAASHDFRGWLLHFSAHLTRVKIPGSFGWDDTVSVVPASADPRYHGKSPYLVVAKYNNYYDVGPHGDGRNKLAVLDPRVSQKDPFANVQTMKAVQTVLSPNHEPGDPAGTRYEWCINTAAVDTADHSVMVNNEDGTLYRWDLARNKLVQKVHLNKPRSEAYTPSLIGADGTVYTINNAVLYAVGR
jgi:hypothetical protein